MPLLCVTFLTFQTYKKENIALIGEQSVYFTPGWGDLQLRVKSISVICTAFET